MYLGGLVPSGADSEHLVSRQQTGEALRAGRVSVTEIRAGIIVGPGSAAYEVMRDLVFNLPLMVTPKWVQSRSSPIALENLLTYLLKVADADMQRLRDALSSDERLVALRTDIERQSRAQFTEGVITAAEYVETLLETAPDVASHHSLRGRIERVRGNLAAARVAFEKALSLDREDLEARRALASMRIAAHDAARGGRR